MKKIPFLILAAIFMATFNADAQFKWGIRGGMSTMDIEPEQLLITNPDDAQSFGLAVTDAEYGVHFGLFTQIQAGKFFIQPEVLFNSNKVNFTLDSEDPLTADAVLSESYQNLDLPIMVGLKMGPLRLQGGPVGHVFISSSSDLVDIQGYDQTFEDLTWGYQAGIGLDIWKIILDFKYEGNLTRFGDHMNFFGQQMNFNDRPGRLIASVGIAF